MIYTFSYDPAVEIEVKTNALVIGKKNTADRLKISYSSSLQYVHNILSCLGASSKATGLVSSGFSRGFEEQFYAPNCYSDFIFGSEIQPRISILLEGSFNTLLTSAPSIQPPKYVHQLQKKLASLCSSDAVIILEPQRIPNIDVYMEILSSTGAYIAAIFDDNNWEFFDSNTFDLTVFGPDALTSLSGGKTLNVDEAISMANAVNRENAIIPLKTGVVFQSKNSDCIYLEYFPTSSVYKTHLEQSLLSGFIAARDAGLPFIRCAVVSFSCACASLSSKTFTSKQEILKYIRLCDRVMHSI